MPGILEQDWAVIENKLELIKPFAKTVHIDLLDGKYAPNITFFDPAPFAKYAKDFTLELHMMVEEPVQYLKPWAAAGFQRFIGHIERMSDQVEFVAQGQMLGEVGLALDARSPIDMLQVPLDDLDSLLVMTVNAGFSGQNFMSEVLQKIETLRDKSIVPITVDGGINNITLISARDAGASRFVTTSFLFHSGDPKTQFAELQTLLPLP